MSLGGGEADKPQVNRESSAINKDRLTTEIAGGIKRRVLGEETITFRRMATGELGRSCFLTTPDGTKSLAIGYSKMNQQNVNLTVQVLDRTTGDQPSGYYLHLEPPDSTDSYSTISFSPSMSSLAPDDKIYNGFEAVYRKRLNDDGASDEDVLAKENLRRGLLLIKELLNAASPDTEATLKVQAWMANTKTETPINNLVEINNLWPDLGTQLDAVLLSLPQVVSKEFSEGDTNEADN